MKINDYVKKISFGIFLGVFMTTTMTNGKENRKDISKNIDVYSSDFSMQEFLKTLTLKEKINFIAGAGFTIHGNKRLNIPEVLMADGPMGVKKVKNPTALIANIGLAATWNRKLSALYGNILGDEAYKGNVAIILAPGVNIYRLPQNGRNFEYLGEDPVLVSQMVVPYIKNIQKHNVMATVKHYIANNQDYNRHKGNSVVSERALREIYMPAFKASVQEGKVAAVMTAYGAINGIHAAEHNYLINEVLRQEWGFDGIVMSDWVSVYDTVNTIKYGVDLEMPRGQYLNYKMVKNALDKGLISENDIDKKVVHIVSTCRKFNSYQLMTKKKQDFDRVKHGLEAKKIADESIVLLKNKNLLPLKAKTTTKKKVVFIGPNALNTPKSGGGAAFVSTRKGASYYDSFKKIANKDSYDIEYVELFPTKDKKYQPVTDINNELYNKIKGADIVVACVGFSNKKGLMREGEASDRSFEMPIKQQQILTNVTSLNPNTLVVLVAGGAVKMTPWIDKTKALIHSWYQGQVGGASVMDVVFGKVNPSGKLPISIEKEWNDAAAFKYYDDEKNPNHFRGYSIGGKHHELEDDYYGEDIFVGYRHFDKNNIEPLFPFGYGLSYTKFIFRNLETNKNEICKDEKLKITLSVKNTGKMKGKEVIQLYIKELKPTVSRPPKELKDFAKIELAPGETKTVEFTIDKNSLKYYDGLLRRWQVNEGVFKIMIGSSSRDIKCMKEFTYRK